jgi:hypothetical protein
LPMTIVERDAGEFGKHPSLVGFSGHKVSVRRGDGSLLSHAVSPYPSALHGYAAANRFVLFWERDIEERDREIDMKRRERKRGREKERGRERKKTEIEGERERRERVKCSLERYRRIQKASVARRILQAQSVSATW